MKNYVSYVIQDAEAHTHHSEIIDIVSSPYNYTNQPEVSAVMKWAKKKRESELPTGQNLIVLNMFKI